MVEVAPGVTGVRIRRPAPAPESPPATATPRRDALVVAFLTVLALGLRLPTIGRGYWVDEGISIGISSHHLTQIPSLLRLDGSPPLFYMILHFWLRAFGSSMVATHVLPLATSVAIVPLAWWCTKGLFGRMPALCAAALAATNPFLNWYATETRMYPLVCGLSMVAVIFTARAILRNNVRDAAVACAMFVALLYTHNWSIYLVGATGLIVLVRALVVRDRRQVAGVLIATGAIGLCYLPWLPTFVYQAKHTAAPWAISPSLGDLVSDPASVLGGTLGAIVLPVLALALGYLWWRRRIENGGAVALVLGVGVTAVIAGWIAAQIEPSWTSRYLAVALGPLLLGAAAALGTSRDGRRVIFGICAMLVAWSVIGSILPDANAQYAKSNVEAVVAAARKYMQPGDLVVVTQSEQLAVAAFYLPTGLHYVTPTGPVSDTGVVDWRDLIARLDASDPCLTVAPSVDALGPGQHILVLNPYEHLGASGTTWAQAVNTRVSDVNDMLVTDKGVRQVAALSPAIIPKPYSAVTGLVYVRTAAPATCSS